MLNLQQASALSAVLGGHNVLIYGQAGTGKTFLLKNLIPTISQQRNVTLLCTTGMGSLQFNGATTVHSWAGLQDGRHDKLTLQRLVKMDDKYDHVRRNIRDADIVIIDEISMLSMRDFEMFEMVCRVARENNRYFGGLQIIVSGDFYQLPPVGNALYGDNGNFCFESEIFKLAITHRIRLEEIVRQNEEALVRAVRETALGCVSDESDAFLKTLERELPNDATPAVHLFPRNIDTTVFNNECLDKLMAESKCYRATKNSGSKKYLKQILAPQYLNLKLGCPVILLRNMGGALVNGLRGTVVKMEEDIVFVDFNQHGIHGLQRHVFSKYDPTKKRNIAERVQYPLVLGYGLTIHKAQGMTLPCVHVHCKGIFQAGQLSVALGRGTTSLGIRILDYRKGLCPQPKSVIGKFYGEESKPLYKDLSCCQREVTLHHYEDTTPQNSKYSDDSDAPDAPYDSDDSEDSDDLEEIGRLDPYILPTYIVLDNVKCIALTPKPVTPTQKRINEICTNLNETHLYNFCCCQHQNIKETLPEDMAKNKTTPKDWTRILSKYHDYISKQEFRSTLPLLFGHCDCLSDDHFTVACEIALHILKEEVGNIARTVSLTQGQSSKTEEVTAAGEAKIRYVGGMCVAKIRSHHVNIIVSNIGNPDPSKIEKVKSAQQKVNCVDKLIPELDMRQKTDLDTSLDEIERRQNVRKALTYITDSAFAFFLCLNKKIHRTLNMETLKAEKGNVFEYTKAKIEADEELKTSFYTLCNNESDDKAMNSLYKDITYKYLMVCHKQLLKDTKDRMDIVKKKAHREEIEKKVEKRKATVTIVLGDIIGDSSQNKIETHLKLKLNCMSNEQYFCGFTKAVLYKLCSAYEVKYTTHMVKKDLASSLRTKVLLSEGIVKVEELLSEQPGPSQAKVPKEQQSAKEKGKST